MSESSQFPWVHPGYWEERYAGLSKRELFAAMAMQGIRSDPNGPGLAERIAEEAVQIADALLKELAK